MTDDTAARTQALCWDKDALLLLDQRRLPHEVAHVRCASPADVARAIVEMVVRGAPAIGIAGAYGVALAAADAWRLHGAAWRAHMPPALALLRAARPTAVNLAWAIDRMAALIAAPGEADPFPALLAEAERIQAEDLVANRRMGELGASVLGRGCRVLTHCNAGALATAGHGTALGVIRSAHARGQLTAVYATETRPWLQGARLTAWELTTDGIEVCLVADGAAAHLMHARGVDWLIVGADRVAANGDVANKIGTYALALAARAHGTRVMVVAPLSTVDPATPEGAAIPIEERPEEELLGLGGQRHAAPGVRAFNPVFDVTPAALIDCLVTEVGVVHRPTRQGIAELLRRAGAA